jgi:N-acetylmuramoyl-L-alanine amidase
MSRTRIYSDQAEMPAYLRQPKTRRRRSSGIGDFLSGVATYVLIGGCVAVLGAVAGEWANRINLIHRPGVEIIQPVPIPVAPIDPPAPTYVEPVEVSLEHVDETPNLGQVSEIRPPNSVDETVVAALAATAWAEARNQGVEGMRAVMHVVTNRARDADLPIDLIVFQPWQFSAWNENDPNRSRALDPPRFDPQWLQAQALARLIVSGQSVDPTNGARFYHIVTCDSPGCTNMRAHGIGPRVMGDHVFYRGMRPRGQS